MRLLVFWPHKAHHIPGKVSIFNITPLKGGRGVPARDKELQQMEDLIPRIKKVGKEVFGEDFQSVVIHRQTGRLEIVMTKGITQSRKKDFDAFRGWIELCGIE